jgi:anti-sigma-K factor RskA
MSHPEQGSPLDLAAAYALGALGPEETREFEAFLASSPEAQREVAEFREVAALLALSGSDAGADSDLRQRVLASVEQSSSGARAIPRRPRPLWGALAASLILLLGYSAGLLWLRNQLARQDAIITAKDQELALTQRDIKERQAILDAILDPRVQLYQLTATGDSKPGIQLFWNRWRNEMLLHGSQLNPVPPGRAYQLWFIQNGKPVPSVTFTPSPTGSATRLGVKVPPGRGVSAAAVTVEPSSGSAQPTSPIVLTGPLKGS